MSFILSLFFLFACFFISTHLISSSFFYCTTFFFFLLSSSFVSYPGLHSILSSYLCLGPPCLFLLPLICFSLLISLLLLQLDFLSLVPLFPPSVFLFSLFPFYRLLSLPVVSTSLLCLISPISSFRLMFFCHLCTIYFMPPLHLFSQVSEATAKQKPKTEFCFGESLGGSTKSWLCS